MNLDFVNKEIKINPRDYFNMDEFSEITGAIVRKVREVDNIPFYIDCMTKLINALTPSYKMYLHTDNKSYVFRINVLTKLYSNGTLNKRFIVEFD